MAFVTSLWRFLDPAVWGRQLRPFLHFAFTEMDFFGRRPGSGRTMTWQENGRFYDAAFREPSRVPGTFSCSGDLPGPQTRHDTRRNPRHKRHLLCHIGHNTGGRLPKARRGRVFIVKYYYYCSFGVHTHRKPKRPIAQHSHTDPGRCPLGSRDG